MKRGTNLFALTILLSACGYDAEDFVSDFCGKIEAYQDGDCEGMALLMDELACGADSEVDTSTCAFNKDDAKACIDGEWTCDADTGIIAFPAACETACPEAS